MLPKGYIVQDSSSQFLEYDYIKKSYIATGMDYDYQIGFYELVDDIYATGFYNNNKSIFESSKGNAFAETSIWIKNYSKYTL